MAKSKNKSKKSNKSSKAKKSNKSTKKAQQIKKSSKVAQQKQARDVSAKKNNTRNIRVGLIVSLIAAIVIGAILIGGAEDKSIKSSAKPTVNPNAQQTIEVKAPNSKGTPEATGVQIQGSSPEGQTAPGGLQKPKSNLQPNAGIEDYENAEIN